jgi:hypothetical protein
MATVPAAVRKINIDDDEVRGLIWNANGVSADILDRADKFLGQLATEFFQKLVGGLAPTPCP